MIRCDSLASDMGTSSTSCYLASPYRRHYRRIGGIVGISDECLKIMKMTSKVRKHDREYLKENRMGKKVKDVIRRRIRVVHQEERIASKMQ